MAKYLDSTGANYLVTKAKEWVQEWVGAKYPYATAAPAATAAASVGTKKTVASGDHTHAYIPLAGTGSTVITGNLLFKNNYGINSNTSGGTNVSLLKLTTSDILAVGGSNKHVSTTIYGGSANSITLNATSAKLSSGSTPTFYINNTSGGNAEIVFDRGTSAANWKIANNSGNLKFQCDWTTAKTSYYDVATFAFNTKKVTFTGTVAAPKFSGTFEGNASTATKLSSPKTITLSGYSSSSAVSFDGSANITIKNLGVTGYMVKGDSSTTTYARICHLNNVTSSWVDYTVILLISRNYVGGGAGILKLSFRTNNLSGSSGFGSCTADWLCVRGLNPDDFIVKGYFDATKCYADLYYKTASTYSDICYYVLGGGQRHSTDPSNIGWILDTTQQSGLLSSMNVRTYNYESLSTSMVHHGTSVPSSSLGMNGDIYIKHE